MLRLLYQLWRSRGSSGETDLHYYMKGGTEKRVHNYKVDVHFNPSFCNFLMQNFLRAVPCHARGAPRMGRGRERGNSHSRARTCALHGCSEAATQNRRISRYHGVPDDVITGACEKPKPALLQSAGLFLLAVHGRAPLMLGASWWQHERAHTHRKSSQAPTGWPIGPTCLCRCPFRLTRRAWPAGCKSCLACQTNWMSNLTACSQTALSLCTEAASVYLHMQSKPWQLTLESRVCNAQPFCAQREPCDQWTRDLVPCLATIPDLPLGKGYRLAPESPI